MNNCKSILQRIGLTQDKHGFIKRVSNHVPSNFPKAKKDRVSNPMSQNCRSGKSPNDWQSCSKCCKKHWVESLVGKKIVLVVERNAIKSRISLIWEIKRSGVIDLNKVVLVQRLQRGTASMLSVLWMNKSPLMWSVVNYKSYLLVFML